MSPGSWYCKTPGIKRNSTFREGRKDFSVEVHLNKYFSVSPSTFLSSILSTSVVYFTNPVKVCIIWTDSAYMQTYIYASLNLYCIFLWWWYTENIHCNAFIFHTKKPPYIRQHPILFLSLRGRLKEDLKCFRKHKEKKKARYSERDAKFILRFCAEKVMWYAKSRNKK